MNSAREVAELGDCLLYLVSARERTSVVAVESPRDASSPSATDKVTSRCCAPSCRLRADPATFCVGGSHDALA